MPNPSSSREPNATGIRRRLSARSRPPPIGGGAIEHAQRPAKVPVDGRVPCPLPVRLNARADLGQARGVLAVRAVYGTVECEPGEVERV